jgi:hypothetical protein
LKFQTKQHYWKATAKCCYAGTEIEGEREVGILATEAKGIWKELYK